MIICFKIRTLKSPVSDESGIWELAIQIVTVWPHKYTLSKVSVELLQPI